jgi:hypothetical protein
MLSGIESFNKNNLKKRVTHISNFDPSANNNIKCDLEELTQVQEEQKLMSLEALVNNR